MNYNSSLPPAARARLIQIEAELERLEALRSERDEIIAAANVLARYAGSDSAPDKQTVRQSLESAGERSDEKRGVGAPRPEGIPTLWSMTEQVLEDAGGTASIHAVVDSIRHRWWPGLDRQQIAPTIYGFAKDGRLKKVAQGRFALARKSASAEAEKPKAEHADDMFGPHNPNHAPSRQ